MPDEMSDREKYGYPPRDNPKDERTVLLSRKQIEALKRLQAVLPDSESELVIEAVQAYENRTASRWAAFTDDELAAIRGLPAQIPRDTHPDRYALIHKLDDEVAAELERRRTDAD